MGDFSLAHIKDVIFHAGWMWISLWCGLAFLTLALLVLMRTSWGHSNPLHKCAALSVLAHLLLAGYATTVQIVLEGSTHDPPPFRMSLVEGTAGGTGFLDHGPVDSHDQAAGGWDQFMTPATMPEVKSTDRPATEIALAVPRSLNLASAAATAPTANLPTIAASSSLGPAAALEPATARPDAQAATPIEAPTPAVTAGIAPTPAVQPGPTAVARRPGTSSTQTGLSDARAGSNAEPGAKPSAGSELIGPLPGVPEPPSGLAPDGLASKLSDVPAKLVSSGNLNDGIAGTAAGDAGAGGSSSGGEKASASAGGNANSADGAKEPGQLPAVYSDRVAGDKLAIVESRGGSAAGESAVQAALKWLAAVQSPDGHWDAAKYGAGKETAAADGHDRRGAGAKADSGITGLALLAMLGAGNTHLQGKYAPNVQHGLEYLVLNQGANGNLGGNAEVFSFMYCHGIATLAMSEAYAMSGDKRLEKPLRSALAYTISAQHPTTGGWRYQPHETGDTSQLGWQLMALKSAELSGIEIPVRTRDGISRFLRSVASGRAGGLASYRPGERPSRTMTAEALLCRQFLGIAQDASTEEAAEYVVVDLPSIERPNLYNWYYGTLALYQVQGPRWQRWTEALQATLIKQQETKGEFTGTWKPDPVWGGYGGRVYSTAMSALCLEIYYRYLPIYGGQRQGP